MAIFTGFFSILDHSGKEVLSALLKLTCLLLLVLLGFDDDGEAVSLAVSAFLTASKAAIDQTRKSEETAEETALRTWSLKIKQV